MDTIKVSVQILCLGMSLLLRVAVLINWDTFFIEKLLFLKNLFYYLTFRKHGRISVPEKYAQFL